MVLNQLKHHQEVAQGKVYPKEDRGPTLDKILANEEQSALFGEMVKASKAGGGFAERLFTGKLNQNELDKAEKIRQDFHNKMEASKKVLEGINVEKLRDLARYSPGFEKILNLAGEKKISEALHHQMELLAIQDPTRFQKLSKAMEKLNSHETGDYKNIDSKVEELCAKHKIDPDQYSEILAIPDEKQRDAALQKVIHEKYNKFQKLGNWLTRGSLAEKRLKKFNDESAKENVSYDEIHIAMDLMSTELKNVGKVLSDTINKNESVRHAVSHVATNKTLEDAPPENLATFEESREQLTDEDIENEWEDFKKEKKLDGDKFGKEHPTEQDKLRDEFIDMQKEKEKEKRGNGFWAMISNLISEKTLDTHKSKLK